MISFLNPGFLWLLLALGPVLALYFLKSKPTKKMISSNILWKIVFARIKPNSFFERFQHSLFLLLQLGAIILFALAAARPTGAFWGGGNRLIILDTSASMMALDVKPSRFQAAVQRAQNLSGGISSGRIGLYTLGERLQPLVPLTNQAAEIRSALAKLSPTFVSTPSSESVLRMLRDLEGLSPDEIFILTDTLDPFIPSDFMPQTAIHVETFGKSGANVAVVGTEAGWDPALQQINASIVIQNENNAGVDISVRIEDKTIPGFPLFLNVSPMQRTSVSLPPIPERKCTVLLSVPEEYNGSTADDRWYLCDPGLHPKVLIDAEKDSILFRLRQALPLIEFVPVSATGNASDAMALLSKNLSDTSLLPLPACMFQPGETSIQPGQILPWEADHPLIKFMNWDSVPVECLYPSPFPGTSLIESVGGSLLAEEWISERHLKRPRIHIGFDPDHPALAGNIFLPVFLYNCLEYMLKDHFPRLSYTVGHPGLKALWKGKSPEQTGFHEVPDRPGITAAVNLQSPSEAVLIPAPAKTPSSTQRTGKIQKEQAASPWQLLLGGVFCLMLFEWFLFLRRN